MKDPIIIDENIKMVLGAANAELEKIKLAFCQERDERDRLEEQLAVLQAKVDYLKGQHLARDLPKEQPESEAKDNQSRLSKWQRGFLRGHSVEEILDRPVLTFRCNRCKAEWIPGRGYYGKLGKYYWKCPNGCKTRGW
jgi:hypothetical protein